MCGIFGYVGKGDAIRIVIDGLKRLEYRGYDSAGIAGVKNGKLEYAKEVGKLSVLEKEVRDKGMSLDIAIGHTRWATHGIPTKINAHPHVDTNRTLAVVHNGIIENHEVLRSNLRQQGIQFVSDTDTEVIAHLIASFYKGDILEAFQQAVGLLKGAFAIGLIHKDFPDQILVTANQCPLVVGIGNQEAFIASDSHALAKHTRQVFFISDCEIAVVTADKVDVYDAKFEQISKELMTLAFEAENIEKGSYAHYTLKEIHEQPQAIRNAIGSRFVEAYGSVTFEELKMDMSEFSKVDRILILGCGSSYHAGLIGSYMLEDIARIPTQVEVASEFRYRNPIVKSGTLVIAISQSGETADTIAAVKEVRAKGCKVLAICNVQGSTITRETDGAIFLRAGPEIGVCSTKGFTTQVVVLSLLTILLARMRHMSKEEGQEFLRHLQKLPDQVQEVLNNSAAYQKLAKKYAKYENAFFIGRRYMYPTSLEGALKLKEISYINASGYAAGEMKHGPIALLNPKCPVFALCANKATFSKLESNLREVKSRSAPLVAVAEEGLNHLGDIPDDVIRVPNTIDELAPILVTVATQLIAYYIANDLGADIDQPRNLAKSVTVE